MAVKPEIPMKRVLALAAFATIIATAPGGSARAATICPAAEQAIAREAEGLIGGGVPGLAVAVGDAGGVRYTQAFGDFKADTVVNLGSATKWLTAATALASVDRGFLTLDTTTGETFPGTPTATESIRLRDLLAHTSGINPPSVFRERADVSMAESARSILSRPLDAAPRTEIRYGGAGFQVAGAMVEAASGKRFQAAFREWIADPLGMESGRYGWPTPDRDSPNPRNPQMGGGLYLSAEDYAKFLAMIANGGKVDGRVILSGAALEAMFTDQTGGATVASAPGSVLRPFGYGVGVWCEPPSARGGACANAHSAGAWGTFPYLDRETGVFTVIVMHDRLDRVIAAERRMVAAVAGCQNTDQGE